MMTPFKVFAACVLTVLFAPLCASARQSSEPAIEGLIGTWEVSLFYSVDAPPSSTQMVIERVEDGLVTGSFYGTPFASVSRASERDGIVAFTAVTRDGTGNYVHSGRLRDGVIEGQTLSEGRGFLMLWRAEKPGEGARN